jgi:hypothetical protein
MMTASQDVNAPTAGVNSVVVACRLAAVGGVINAAFLWIVFFAASHHGYAIQWSRLYWPTGVVLALACGLWACQRWAALLASAGFVAIGVWLAMDVVHAPASSWPWAGGILSALGATIPGLLTWRYWSQLKSIGRFGV